ncbi:hypothetical protein P8864_16420, partial [Priestia flexa]|uniref:hypothetical protein n=1 Tax=Priestia flexa TaxID=86664 RepID=UPI002DB5D1CD
GKTEIPQRSEEAQVPPRGKRVAVAQWNERVQTNQKDWNSYCSSLRNNHFVMSQTLFILNSVFKNILLKKLLHSVFKSCYYITCR